MDTINVSGTVEGLEGEPVDTSHINPDPIVIPTNVTDTDLQITTSNFVNTGNVGQKVTVTATNLSANVISVTPKFTYDSTNTRNLAPNASDYLIVDVVLDLPEESGIGEPANTEPFSFDLVATWTTL